MALQQSFNPKARWDRHIPETSAEHQEEPDILNEKIQVLAWFKGTKLIPRIFIWKNKSYKIKKITYNWQERQGKEIIIKFSVSTQANLYQISFNNTTLGWRLEKVIE